MLVFSLLPALQAVRDAGRRESAPERTHGSRPAASVNGCAARSPPRRWRSRWPCSSRRRWRLTAADRAVNGVLGFDKHNVLVGQLVFPTRTYEDAEKRRQFVTKVVEAMRPTPAGHAYRRHQPYPRGIRWQHPHALFPDGVQVTEPEARAVDFRRVTTELFGALKIPLLRGRWFDDSDRSDTTPVAVVSTAVAQRYWGDADPIGKRFKLAIDGPLFTVIGVSGNVMHNWFIRRDETVYRPISQDAPFTVAFAVRTIGDPTTLSGDLRRAVAAADPDQPMSLVALDQLVEERAGGFTFIAKALGVVAVIALVLSILGIYSLMAYLTAQRTHEIGVRMALGAGRLQVIRATTKRALGITVAGTGIGAALAFALGRVMQGMLQGFVTTNLVQLLAIAGMLASAGLLAAYFPARRAAGIDPMNALRET